MALIVGADDGGNTCYGRVMAKCQQGMTQDGDPGQGLVLFRHRPAQAFTTPARDD
jgi:hypothetical protein